MTVYFIGAGPGAKDLITLRGARLLKECLLIVYTGSLVPRSMLEDVSPDANVLDSKGMNLDEILKHIEVAHKQGKDIARLHTGDPMIYGAIAEQMRRLDDLNIPWEIVPGVSSFTAAAAAVGRELTLPEVVQTVIVSRVEGRTPMPEGEDLASLGSHRATLCLFLSITLMDKIVRELTPKYGADCPVAIVHRASWPDQQIITGTLSDIEERVEKAGIRSQSIIFVGRFLSESEFPDSRLYDETFTHRFRKGNLAKDEI